MKGHVKKLTASAVAVLLSFVLAACRGGTQTPSNGTTTSTGTSETTAQEKSSLAGKYLPFAIQLGDFYLSYSDMQEAYAEDGDDAGEITDMYLEINDDGKNGEFKMDEEDPIACTIDQDNKTITLTENGETVNLDYELNDDTLTIVFTEETLSEVSTEETAEVDTSSENSTFRIHFAKEGDAFEKAKEDSEKKSSIAQYEIEDGLETTDEAATEEAAAATTEIREGTIDLEYVTVELADGWYAEETPEEHKAVLINDSSESFIADITIEVKPIYDNHGAEYWASAIQGNYGGKGTIGQVTYNGINYYKLSGVTDDDTQTMLFADVNDEYYMEVAVMFMPFSEGESMLNHIAIK